MIPHDDEAFERAITQSTIACEALSDEEDSLKREVLSHAGNRWSLGIIHLLGVGGTLRHAEIARRSKGVSQRMLTRSLRQLERHGLVVRTDYGEVPPRVEYGLSNLGRGLLVGMIPLWSWVIDNAEAFRDARDTYDQRR